VDEAVELGAELLAHVEEPMSVAEAVDRIETVTTDPATTRRILEEAERRGAVERQGTTVRPRSGTYLSFESEVHTKDGEFTCRRCGADLSTGHFVAFDAGEHGPFGSSCVRKLLGRD
jgi:formamidopyrimidine-DNA glycosylase